MWIDSLNGFFHFNDVINKWGVNAAFMSGGVSAIGQDYLQT